MRELFALPEMHQFTWEGQLMSRYQLEAPAVCFGVDETDENIYCVILDEESLDYYIKRFNLLFDQSIFLSSEIIFPLNYRGNPRDDILLLGGIRDYYPFINLFRFCFFKNQKGLSMKFE